MADTIKASKDSFDELQFLREISLTLACSEDSQLLLNNLQAVFEKYLSVSNFRIFIKDESSNTLKDFVKNWITVGKNPQQELVENIFQRLKNINDTGFILNNKLIKYTDKKDKLFLQNIKTEQNLLYFPVYNEKNIIGVIEINFNKLTKDIDLKRFLTALRIAASQINTTIVNKILNQKLCVQIKFQKVMRSIAKLIENQFELNYILPIIGELIDGFVQEHLIYIFTKDENDNFKLFWPLDCQDSAILSLLPKINKKKIVVIVDECHRSTFGEMLLRIRNTFSNAMFIGFTGTPILDENSKDSITTKDIFGNELHEYTIADGIRDGNVLGFDCTKVITLREDDVRVAVALHKAKAKSVEEVNENKNKKKIFDEWYGKDIEKLEDHLPRSQYASDEHRNAVVSDILSSWPIVSQNKYHAIFATSSILEAIAYYRLLKMKNTGLKITALFDASYDNEVNTIEKEDGLREIIIDYNAMFNKEFNLSTFPKMKKDIANRLAHKKPYLNLKKEEQIDILIVVNQMLTGYDSKWVSTLFLDKVLENEHLIQAFSRTNRPFGDQKSFGLIRFYRKPNRMEKNIQKAIKLYSGNRELEVFAPNIDSHIQEMNAQFMIIEKIFTDMPNFAHLPKAEADIAKFVKCFNILYKNMLAAQLQGFTWENKGNLLFDEQTYLVLLQRYKDVAREVSGGGGGTVDSPPYDIDINLSTQRMDRIDTEYMNERFHRYIHLLDLSETSQEELEEALNQLHQMFALLSYEQQQIAEMILLDVQSGRFKCPENITFKELITQRLMETTKGYMIKVQNAFGLNIDLLQKIMEQGNKKNLNEFGLYNKLKESIDLDKAREYFSKKTGKSISVFKVNMMIDELLRKFIQEDGFDIDEIEL